jgi:hypothetical protein
VAEVVAAAVPSPGPAALGVAHTPQVPQAAACCLRLACLVQRQRTNSPTTDKETYGEAHDPAYAYDRAEANFRRFSKGLEFEEAVPDLAPEDDENDV